MYALNHNSNHKIKAALDQQKPDPLFLLSPSAGSVSMSGQLSNLAAIPAKTISHYKIIEKIGEGGMGVIYKAFDLNLQRAVAIKILPPHLCTNEDIKNRFLREARLLSALEHPYICTIHDIFEDDDGALYMVMTCYQGKTLRTHLEQGQISLEKAIAIVKQIASGLIEAHKKGIVHQDIKPENIFITTDEMVKIIDFGVARLIDHNRDGRDKTSVGTLAYMSPEQASRLPVDQRTDIWSLGVVFYEMLSGRLPFREDYEQALIYAIMKEKPPSLKHTPKELNLIVEKCLEKDLDNRYQHMREILTDLEVFLTRNNRLASLWPGHGTPCPYGV